MDGINRDKEFEVQLFAVEFVGELGKESLEGTAPAFVCYTESRTQCFEDTAFLFVRAIGVRGEFFDSRDVMW